MQVAIEVDGIRKSYAGGVHALNEVGFTVSPGIIFGLLGPNGAGKSTLVRILTTLSNPDAGAARVQGFDVMRQAAAVRQVIGVVAQQSGVDPGATGYENLILQGQLFGLGGRVLHKRVQHLLESFSLAEVASRAARTYSGGMRRRLDIAMALVHRPQVLFLDEPTTGLDPEVRASMWEEVQHLAHHEGMTILLTTHYLEEADRLASELAILDQGRIVAQGTPAGLKGELEGEGLQIELQEDTDGNRIRQALGPMDGLRDVVITGRIVHTRTDNGPGMVPEVLRVLTAAGIAIASATVTRPSLDDVYLRYTGRTMNNTREEVYT